MNELMRIVTYYNR